VWFDSNDGPRFLCGADPNDVIAAVSDRRIHEFPMDLVCPECLRAFANKRLNIQFHISVGDPNDNSPPLCGIRQPEYLVNGKYADGLDPDAKCSQSKNSGCKPELQAASLSYKLQA
jgi:hypothetical protein